MIGAPELIDRPGFATGSERSTNRDEVNAALTIRTFKAGAVELRKHESERDMARLDALVAECFESEDYVEGRRAFMEKRKPAFKGL